MVKYKHVLLSMVIHALCMGKGYPQAVSKAGMAPQTIEVKLRLRSSSAVVVSPAPLKYNKHLALSFTLDDGYRSAYLTAFPLLHGGKISPPFPDEWKNDEGGDGSYSDGLYYSDGCGKAVPFKFAAAINGAGIRSAPQNRGALSWPEVKELYAAGWDILNHGYHHATKHGTDYEQEVIQNQLAVKKQLGFTMSHFIVPGGEGDPGYEQFYEQSALSNGILSVGSVNGSGPVFPVKEKTDLAKLVYHRDFITSDSIPLDAAKKRLGWIDSLIRQKDQVWIHQFTHGTGNSNLWNLSMVFPEFKYYMSTLASRYGIKGSDQLWMAPWQEVYEYIWLRDRIKISTTQAGKEVTIKMTLPEIPANFRYRVVTLNIKTGEGFIVQSQSAGTKTSFSSLHRMITVEINR